MATCHENEHASYLKTAHSRALAKVDPSAEPPDAEFIQQVTGRTYSVYRKRGELRHREAVGVDDETLLFHDMPMKYVIGSGHYSRSYMAMLRLTTGKRFRSQWRSAAPRSRVWCG